MRKLMVIGLILFFSTVLAIDINDGSLLQLKNQEGSLMGLGVRENDELELKVLFGVSGPLMLELRNADGMPEVFSALLDDNGRLLVFEFDTWVDLGDLLRSRGIEFKLEREDRLPSVGQAGSSSSSSKSSSSDDSGKYDDSDDDKKKRDDD